MGCLEKGLEGMHGYGQCKCIRVVVLLYIGEVFDRRATVCSMAFEGQ